MRSIFLILSRAHVNRGLSSIVGADHARWHNPRTHRPSTVDSRPLALCIVSPTLCWSRPTILFGIPSDIIDTRGTIEIIDTRDNVDVFHPAPFGIVDILDTIGILARTTLAWSTTRRPQSAIQSDIFSGVMSETVCVSYLAPFEIAGTLDTIAVHTQTTA